jgi:hypothetical protein
LRATPTNRWPCAILRDSHQEGPTHALRTSPGSTADKAENPIVAESRSFASVIEPWHRTHNASATLALLDAHERRYPSGHMRLESRVLRAEIYLAQGRESEALAVLDSVSLSGIPRAPRAANRARRAAHQGRPLRRGQAGSGRRSGKGVADALAKRAAQAMSHCP